MRYKVHAALPVHSAVCLLLLFLFFYFYFILPCSFAVRISAFSRTNKNCNYTDTNNRKLLPALHCFLPKLLARFFSGTLCPFFTDSFDHKLSYSFINKKELASRLSATPSPTQNSISTSFLENCCLKILLLGPKESSLEGIFGATCLSQLVVLFAFW